MRVYNGTGGEVIWYVTSMSGPNAGQFFEVTIPAGGAVILNVGDWANGNVIQVLTSEGGAAAFGSTAVLGDSSIDEVDTVRSEEHTSELQSLMRISYAVFCLKKKTKKTHKIKYY